MIGLGFHPTSNLCIVLKEMLGVVADLQKAPKLGHVGQNPDVLDDTNPPRLWSNALSTHCETHILDLGAGSLAFGQHQFGSGCRELTQDTSALKEMVFEGAAPHKNIVHIDEVTTSGNIAHHLVEEDVD